MASQVLAKGYTFSGTPPNNNVTAEKLNALVDSATILPAFYTGATLVGAAGAGALSLLYDPTSGTYQSILSTNLIPTGKASRGFINLKAQNNTGTPNTKIDVTADALVLRSSSTGVFYMEGFSVTIDNNTFTTPAAANGRDFSGSVAANTWYYLYAISDGTSTAGLFSSSATSPTLPTGYLYYVLLGAVRTDASNFLIKFTQRDLEVSIAIASLAGASNAVLNPWTANHNAGNAQAEFAGISIVAASTFQSADLSRCIPPNIVSKVYGLIGSTASGTETFAVGPACAGTIDLPTTSTGMRIYRQTAIATTAYGFTNSITPFECAVTTSQQIMWACVDTGINKNMRILGFTLNL